MGTEVLQFLDSLAIRHQDDFEEKDNIILFFISSWCNNSSYNSNRPNAKQLTRQGTEKILSPNSSDDLCLLFCINSSSMMRHKCIIVHTVFQQQERYTLEAQKFPHQRQKMSALETKYFHIRDVHVGLGWDGSQGRASPALFNCFLRIGQERNISIPETKYFHTRD